MSPTKRTHSNQVTRRDLLKRAAGVAAAGAAMATTGGFAAEAGSGKAVTKGRIKQSIVFWCFNVAGDKWDIEQQCQVANKLGCKSVELVEPTDFATLKKHGLVCAITPNGMPGAPFVKGLNNLKYHDEVIARTTKSIEATAAAGFPNVIAFNGY
jgi:hydroxypyruvate isomerase